jgi:chromate transporter
MTAFESTVAMLGLHGHPWSDIAAMFGHFLTLSLLAIGGAISTAPDMQRYLVGERGWLSDGDFTASVALAQAAPGPNLLFIVVLGWNIAGVVGVVVALLGILIPSTTLTIAAWRYGERRRDSRGLRAFTGGMAPLTIGLVLATGWVLMQPTRGHPVAMALAAGTVLLSARGVLGPVWLIAIGAAVGAMGWV